MKELSKFFKALSDPSRLRILRMLAIRPLCVCEIQAVLQLAASTVSKHLSILRDAGFIIDEKENKWVNYSLNRQSVNYMVQALLPLLLKWMATDDVFKNDVDAVTVVDRSKLCKM